MSGASFLSLGSLGVSRADKGVRFPFPAGTNRIDRFQRVPSDLRRYLEYTAQIKAEYGSVMRFVVKERLGWGDGNDDIRDLQPKGSPFTFDGMCYPMGWMLVSYP